MQKVLLPIRKSLLFINKKLSYDYIEKFYAKSFKTIFETKNLDTTLSKVTIK